MTVSKGFSSFIRKPYAWAFSTYFAEGFPYTIIRTLSSVFFRDRGMSLEAIGITSVFGLPWVLKFLWGPLIDTFGTKKRWMLVTQGILCLLFFSVALIAPLQHALGLIAAIFFIASFIAATHDIAIDGYYMEALDNEAQAKYVGYRVMAYRIAMMTGTGVIATVGTVYNWFSGFFLAACLLTALFFFHLTTLRECGPKGPSIFKPSLLFIRKNLYTIASGAILVVLIRSFNQSDFFQTMRVSFPLLKKLSFPAIIGLGLFLALIILWLMRNKIRAKITNNPDSFYSQSFLSFMDRDRIGVILAFIIFIRAGEFMLSAMYSPFIVDVGLKSHYGWISAGVGLPCSIVGAMVGGLLISKYSLKKMIWPFLFLQNFTNLIYMALALSLSYYITANTGNDTPIPLTSMKMFAVAATHGFDQFSGGLGTAVLMTFLMRICLKEFKASHYAIGTGLMSVSGLYAGVISGFLTSWVGYGYFFGISFLLSIPGMLLIFWLPLYDKPEGSPAKL